MGGINYYPGTKIWPPGIYTIAMHTTQEPKYKNLFVVK